MTQTSSEVKIPDYSFPRRFLGLLLSALALVAGLVVILVVLVIALVMIFPPAIMGLTMMFAYSLEGLTGITITVFISMLVAALIATAFGRDSNTLRALSVTAYFVIGILSSVILYATLDFEGPLIMAVAIIAITTVGPALYVNNAPSAKRERAFVSAKHRKDLLDTISTENFSTFEDWLKEQSFPEGDPRGNPQAWIVSAYRDATIHMPPKGSSKEILMTRNGRAVSFKDNDNRDDEYTTSYEALWQNNA